MPIVTGNKHSAKIFTDILRASPLPRLETEILISFLLGKSREYLMAHPETKIPFNLYRKFEALETKRLKNWPIAYLTGHKEFYGLDFKVSPAVLTPRPETEMIVEEIVSLIGPDQYRYDKEPCIIDIGTGSGAIIIALASEIRRLFPARFHKIKFAAVDISAAALKIAAQNARQHKLAGKIKFYRGNLLRPLKLRALEERPLIIVANLPYLTPVQIKRSPSISYEPKLALDGGIDGLKYYRRLLRQLDQAPFTDSFLNLFCEIDPSQATRLKFMVSAHWTDARYLIKKDLAGQRRLARIVKGY
ncbi:MAG: peptide chain release factor N(5)-glutamine methyltransferase [Patescibacteria group bacterium]